MKTRLILTALITTTLTLPLYAFDKMKLTESHEKSLQVESVSADVERAPSSTEVVPVPVPEKKEDKFFKEKIISGEASAK